MQDQVTGHNKQDHVGVPRQAFLFCLGLAIVLPLLARLPGIPMRGWGWLSGYLPGLDGLWFLGMFSAIPGLALFTAAKTSRRWPLAFWGAVSASVWFLLWAHGKLDLRSSSTAGIALIFIPIYCVGAAVVGWILGWVASHIVTKEAERVWISRLAIVIAVTVAVTQSALDSMEMSAREARFPRKSVSDIPLTKRQVLYAESVGRVDALGILSERGKPGYDILALSRTAITKLASDYSVKSSQPFRQQECEHCVHMYPYLVLRDDQEILVATSDGLSDSQGRLLWANQASGFSRTVPIHATNGEVVFADYHVADRIELRKRSGEILWSVKTSVQDVGVYVGPDGIEMPFSICGCGKSPKARVYGIDGKLAKEIPLPEWAGNVQSIAWPSKGNLLVGSGGWIGVLDSDGRELMRHTIQGTSFRPYHGPDGVAVRFEPNEPPYLAVASHGSSGYPRSVLLIFAPNGKLVWQEEVKKFDALLAAPKESGQGEVLLVGGNEGILEFRLPEQVDSPVR